MHDVRDRLHRDVGTQGNLLEAHYSRKHLPTTLLPLASLPVRCSPAQRYSRAARWQSHLNEAQGGGPAGVALSVQSPGHPSAQGLRPNWSPPGGQASGDDLDTAPGVIRQGPRREGVSPDGSWGWASVLGWAWGCPPGIVADLLIVGISTVPLGQLLRRCRARSLRPALDAPGVGLASGQARLRRVGSSCGGFDKPYKPLTRVFFAPARCSYHWL